MVDEQKSDGLDDDMDDLERDWWSRIAEFSRGREKAFAEAMRYRGEAVKFQKMGLWDEAIDQWQLATKLIPDFPDFHVNLGYCFAQKDMHDQAITIFEDVMRKNPDAPNARYYLGDSYFHKHMYDEAMASYQSEISVSGENPAIHFKMAIVYSSKGQKEGKDAIKRGVKQKEGLAYLVSPLLEKGLLEFLRAKDLGFVFSHEHNEYFDQVCRGLDEVNRGRLQEIGIPLTLNRLTRVIMAGSCREEPRKEMCEVEFTFPRKISSAVMYSCVSGTKRQQAQVWLYPTEAPDDSKPIGSLSIVFPGYDDSSGSDLYKKATCSVVDFTNVTCNQCHGSGKCSYCKGDGKTGTIFKKSCTYCNATGTCQECKGVGKLES